MSETATVHRASRSAEATPAARVAMVGAGQLARMTHQAAIDLGIELRVLAADDGEPAVRAGAAHMIGSADDLEDLRRLAQDCAVVTFDHERIPPEHLRTLERDGIPLAPGHGAKLLAQDKLHARRELARLGFPVPPFADARTQEDADQFAAVHGWPLIGKAPRGGYDGRGVWTLDDPAAVEALLDQVPDGLVLEPRLAIERELAILVARSATGQLVAYPVVETVQRAAMCRELLVPAQIEADLADRARDLALDVAQSIEAVGILAVELFVVGGDLLINELALRPHNSGHYTIEGAVTSQFEQHLRAILGWPLGITDLTAPAVVTVNVVGTDAGGDPRARVARALAVPGARVHLYDKRPRPGRKLGHVTVSAGDVGTARAAARHASAILEGRA